MLIHSLLNFSMDFMDEKRRFTMFFDLNKTEFTSDYQREIWQFGVHITPPSVSLADVENEEVREGCMQIYDCTMEILSDMYNHSEDYKERPRWYTGDYLAWLVNGNKPMKKHSEEFSRYLKRIPQFGFAYNEDTKMWTNERYPLFCDYFQQLVSLAKERKQNLGGYLDRRDFRLFAKRILLTLDDLLRPLSDRNRAYALEMHNYALSKGMKVEIKDPYMCRYTYNKIYSVELHNNPFCVMVIYRLDNGKYVHDQFERFLSVIEQQPDEDELVRYIQGGICVCTGCHGLHKANERCGKWINIHGARRLASMCHPAISKYRRGMQNLTYLDEDIHMLKRMIDVRVAQVDKFTDI
jgi:hypothetical protein